MAARTARLPAVGSGTATGPADLLAERVVVLVLAMPFALAPGLLPQFPFSTLSCGTDRDGVRLLREPRGPYPLAPLGHRLEVSPAGWSGREISGFPATGEGRMLDAADTRWRPRRLPGLLGGREHQH